MSSKINVSWWSLSGLGEKVSFSDRENNPQEQDVSEECLDGRESTSSNSKKGSF